MRRDIRRHPDSNAASAVYEEIGKTRRKDRRLALGIIVVILVVDCIIFQVLKKRLRDFLEPDFGITHRGWRIAIDRAEIALTVNQGDAHGEILHHAHKRIVDRLVSVGMVFTDDIADDASRLPVGLIPLVAVLVHGVEDAAVDGLQTVANIRQRSRHDNAHRVVEVRTLHLISDEYRANFTRAAITVTAVETACQN